jgi:hypothetical protein
MQNKTKIIRDIFAAYMSNDRKAVEDAVRWARSWPTITSEIISSDMSVPQNPVRLVDERRFCSWPAKLKPNGA